MGTAALAALPGWTKTAFGKPNLRVGILSDIHVTSDADASFFEKALRYFDARKVDAVLVTGDLFTWGSFPELEAVGRAWFKVFPGDRRSDGGPVVRLFVTGNHDVDGFAYGPRFDTLESARASAFYFHREEQWEKVFHEAYEPVTVKTVKGYVFVLRHWMSILGTEKTHKLIRGVPFPDEVSPLPQVMASLKLPEGRPFFYAQHESLDDTVLATWLTGGLKWNNGQDRGQAKAVLDRYPNCVAFTGHCHHSLTDERSIWQGSFTAVNCSCARGWAFTVPGRENGFACPDFNRTPPLEMPRLDNQSVRQGMVMEVYDDRIVLERREWTYDQTLGPDWVIPLFGGRTVPSHGTPKYDFKARAAASRAPVFPANAKLTVRRVKDGRRRDGNGVDVDKRMCEQVWVEFPPITTRGGSPSRGFDFTVCCETRDADIVRVVDECRVFSPNALQTEARDLQSCRCAFPGERVPSNRDVRFTVVPHDCWGNAGAELVSKWMRV